MILFKRFNITLFGIFGICAILLLASCHKQNAKVREKIGDTVEVGLVFPEMRTTNNDTLKLALYPHARFFFLDLGLKNSDGYINLIKKANKADAPVRVRVYKENQAEVAEIIPATIQEIEKIRNH